MNELLSYCLSLTELNMHRYAKESLRFVGIDISSDLIFMVMYGQVLDLAVVARPQVVLATNL